MSFIRGLIVGVVIAALYVLAGRARIQTEQLTLSGNSTLAIAVLAVLVPLNILWGWTWVSDRWSGRSGPRLALYTLGLVLATAAAFPLDAMVSAGAPERVVFNASLSVPAVDGILFVVPVVAVAAILYWAFGSGKLPLALPTLAVAYLISLPLALVFPPAAMGAVAGTAAGHAWREPGARALIATLVILIMLVAAVELPLAAASADGGIFQGR